MPNSEIIKVVPTAEGVQVTVKLDGLEKGDYAVIQTVISQSVLKDGQLIELVEAYAHKKVDIEEDLTGTFTAEFDAEKFNLQANLTITTVATYSWPTVLVPHTFQPGDVKGWESRSSEE